VSFSHRRHQEIAKDCAACHPLFPRKNGNVDKLKKGRHLRKKKVMNALFTTCHKERKRNGVKSPERLFAKDVIPAGIAGESKCWSSGYREAPGKKGTPPFSFPHS
jgi:hypothetical protein